MISQVFLAHQNSWYVGDTWIFESASLLQISADVILGLFEKVRTKYMLYVNLLNIYIFAKDSKAFFACSI